MPQAILLQDHEHARRARHGRRRLEGLPAQLPDPAQAGRAGHQGLDRRRRAPQQAAERAVAERHAQRAQENAELLNKTVLTIAAPGRRRRPPVRLRHRRRTSSTRSRRPAASRSTAARSTSTSRSARSAPAWSSSRSTTASPRPSRRWSSSRSSAPQRRRARHAADAARSAGRAGASACNPRTRERTYVRSGRPT